MKYILIKVSSYYRMYCKGIKTGGFGKCAHFSLEFKPTSEALKGISDWFPLKIKDNKCCKIWHSAMPSSSLAAHTIDQSWQVTNLKVQSICGVRDFWQKHGVQHSGSTKFLRELWYGSIIIHKLIFSSSECFFIFTLK